MSSISLPALAIRPPEQPDLLGEVGKISQLKNSMLTQQLGQQRLQEGQLSIQESQRKQQEAQAFRQAYVDVSKSMPSATQSDRIDAVTNKLSTNPNVSPEMLQGLQLHSQDLRLKTATADEATSKIRQQQINNLRGAFQPIYDLPTNTPQPVLENAYQQQRAKILQNPQVYGVNDPNSIPPQFPGKQAGQFLMDTMIGESQQWAEKKDKSEIAKNAAQAQEAGVKAQQGQLTLAGTSPTGVTAEQQQQQQSRAQQLRTEAQRAFEAARHNRVDEAQGQTRIQQQVNDKGTWSVQEDPTGKPVLFNNKTGEVKDAPTQIAKAGTYQKQLGGAEESVQYAKDYIDSKNFTGPGDEALMEKFFDVAKPSTGFRMTQPQMDMLNNARDAYQGLLAKGKHLLSPNAPYFDDTQRQHIVDTMNNIMASKRKAHGMGSPSSSGGPTAGAIENGYKFKGGDPGKQENWEKQ